MFANKGVGPLSLSTVVLEASIVASVPESVPHPTHSVVVASARTPKHLAKATAARLWNSIAFANMREFQAAFPYIPEKEVREVFLGIWHMKANLSCFGVDGVAYILKYHVYVDGKRITK